MGDLMRAVRIIGLAAPKPLPVVRCGDADTFRSMVTEAGIQIRESTGGLDAAALMGIPVRVDPSLPENVVIVGDRVLMRRGIGDWITFPLSALDELS